MKVVEELFHVWVTVSAGLLVVIVPEASVKGAVAPPPPQADPASCTPVDDHLRQLPAVGVPFTSAIPDAASTAFAKAVATPVPRPETPVEIGKPVRFVATPLAGVPNAGATNVLLESVSVPARVARVPVVGNVTDVFAVVVSVVVNAPDVVNEPPSETALPPMLPTVVARDPAVLVISPVWAGS